MFFSILFSRLSLLLFRFRLSVARLVLESVWLHNDRTFFLARIDWKLLFWYLLPPLLLLLLSNCTKSRHTQKNNNKRRRPNMSTNMSSHFFAHEGLCILGKGCGSRQMQSSKEFDLCQQETCCFPLKNVIWLSDCKTVDFNLLWQLFRLR